MTCATFAATFSHKNFDLPTFLMNCPPHSQKGKKNLKSLPFTNRLVTTAKRAILFNLTISW